MARTKPAIDPRDPRLALMAAAGALRADEAHTAGGWRKCPAQCPVADEVMKGATAREVIELSVAWNRAYLARSSEHAAAALAAMGYHGFPSAAGH